MNNDGLWQRAEDLFHRALEQPVPDRDGFVREHCDGDAVLLERVLDMLAETSAVGPAKEGSTEPSTPTVPARFGRHDVVREIGHGGMGVVYKARQRNLNRSIAQRLGSDGDALRAGGTRDESIRKAARFLEVAEELHLLERPGVVPVLELDPELADVTGFTMRLVQSEDLRTVMECVKGARDGWTMDRAIGVIRRVCDALSFANQRGVLHQDVKLSNIMVGPFDEVYLTDWGLAQIRPPDGGEGRSAT